MEEGTTTFYYIPAGLVLLIALFRLSTLIYAFVRLAKRRELTSFDIRFSFGVGMMECAALLLVGIHFLLMSIHGDSGSLALVFAAGVLVTVAILMRTLRWVQYVRKPMDPGLIEAAGAALDLLETRDAGATRQSSVTLNGELETVRYRLREALAPYRKSRL